MAITASAFGDIEVHDPDSPLFLCSLTKPDSVRQLSFLIGFLLTDLKVLFKPAV